MDIRICDECGMHCKKDEQCLALRKLFEVYQETRHTEKIEIVKRLRPLLQIVDFDIADDIQELAEHIIKLKTELYIIPTFNIRIGYVRAWENKNKNGRAVFADCRKITGSYQAYLPYDFLITIYEPNMAWLTENQKKIVIYHELRHVGMTERGLTVVPHDTEDFNSILEHYGLYWSEPGHDVVDILAGGEDAEANDQKQKAKKRKQK
jgi:predicted metallopeptidase